MHVHYIHFEFTLNVPGNENEVQLLLDSTNLIAVDENGNSALLLAAEKGDNINDCEMKHFSLIANKNLSEHSKPMYANMSAFNGISSVGIQHALYIFKICGSNRQTLSSILC